MISISLHVTCFLQNHQYDDNNDGDDDNKVDHGDSDDDGDDVEDDSWQWSPCRGLPHYSFSAPTHLGNTCETHCVHQLVHSCTNQYSPVPTNNQAEYSSTNHYKEENSCTNH